MPSQGQTSVTVTSPGKSALLPNFKGGVATGMGIAHIIVGLLVIIFEIISRTNNNYLSFALMGVWIGIFLLLTGGVGIGAGKTKKKRLVVSYLVLSAIATMLAVGLLAYAVMSLLLNPTEKSVGLSRDSETDDLEETYPSNTNNSTAERWTGTPYPDNTQLMYTYKTQINMSMNVAMIVMAGVEFIIGIISAVFCCIGYCGKPIEQTQVMYVAQSQPGTVLSALSPQGQQIIMLQQGGSATPQLQRSMSPKETEALGQQSTQDPETGTAPMQHHPDPPPSYGSSVGETPLLS